MAILQVVIADDHPLLRRGLRQIVDAQRDMRVVAEASRGEEILPLLSKGCDVLLLDLVMPDRSGLDVLGEVTARFPGVRVIVLTGAAPDTVARRALRAGAAGFLTQASPPQELVEAIRRVAAGGRYLSHAVAEQMAWEAENPPASLREALSARERQVLRLLVEGRRVGEIAESLALSPKTVSTYRARLLEKLGLANIAELVRYAVEHRLLDGEHP